MCSCDYGVVSVPDDAEVDVPTNVAVVARSARNVDQDLPDLRLLGPGNQVVPSELSTLSEDGYLTSWVELRPVSNLDPLTEYTLRRESEYGPTHFATFTTGDGPDDVTPPAPVIDSLEGGHQEFLPGCSNSCYGEHRDYLDVPFARGDSDAYYEVELSGPDHLSVRHILSENWWPGFENSSCRMGPPALAPDQEWCVRLTAVSANGQRSAASEPACTSIRDCADVDPCMSSLSCAGAPAAPDAGATPAPASSGCSGSPPAGSPALIALFLLWLGLGRQRPDRPGDRAKPPQPSLYGRSKRLRSK